MQQLFGNTPWAIRIALMGGGGLVGAFSGRLPDTWQDIGLYTGLTLCSIGVVATIWHLVNVRRRQRGKPVIMFEPIHLIGVGLLVALIGVGWQIWRGPTTGSPSAELQSQISEIRADLDRYVKPRRITEEQHGTIVKFLLDRKPPETVHILHHSPDDEAASYAAQINHALIKADWKTTSYAGVPPNLPREDRTIIKTGIYFFVEYTPTQHENSRAIRLLEDAFREAKIQAGGMGSWTNSQGKEMKLYLCIGPRPRK